MFKDYKEIKYISHNLRNFYLFFLLYLIFKINYNIEIDLFHFLLWIFWYSLSYSFIYFLNDFYDKNEDLKNKKHNLYLDIKNKNLFFILWVIIPLIWVIISFFISKISLIFIFLLYFLNFIYSHPKIKLRNKYFLREINIFIIYFIKWLLITIYLWINPFLENNFILFTLWSSFACLNLILYKNLFSIKYLPNLFFWSIFLISFIASIFYFKWILILFFPLFFIIFIIKSKYKNNIPFWKYQFYYFLYMILVFIFYIKFAKTTFSI